MPGAYELVLGEYRVCDEEFLPLVVSGILTRAQRAKVPLVDILGKNGEGHLYARHPIFQSRCLHKERLDPLLNPQ